MTIAALAGFTDIATDNLTWNKQLFNRVREYEINCPIDRTRKLYFSNSGNDTTGDGSILNPYATRAKAMTLDDADTALLFACGSTFYETGNWDVGDDVTIGAYGNPALGLPIFDRSSIFKLAANDPWGTPTGAMGRKQCNEATAIAWLKFKGTLGITRPLARASSAVDCETRANSWFWGTSVLYVNLNGDDPNDFDFDCIVSNDGENGVRLTGDGSRVRYIRGFGWGLHTSTTDTQDQPFSSNATGNNTNIIEYCEAFYSGSHCIAHYSATGGRLLVRNCKAGWAKFNGANGETIYNSFAESGGNETLFLDNEVTNGTLPSSDWSYSTLFNRGDGFYSHRGASGTTDLIVIKGNTIKNNTAYGAKTLGNAGGHPAVSTQGNWSTFRCFVVENVIEKPLGAIVMPCLSIATDILYYNNRYFFWPASGGVEALSTGAFLRMAFLQNYINADLQTVTSAFGTYNAAGFVTGSNYGDFWHNFIFYENVNNTNNKGLFDYDVGIFGSASSVGVVGSGSSKDCRFFNNIVCAEATGINCFIAGTNVNANMKNNVIYGLTQTNNVERGYNNATSTIPASSLPVFGTSCPQALESGNTSILFTRDINGKFRTNPIPDIGPIDFSSPVDISLINENNDINYSVVAMNGSRTITKTLESNDIEDFDLEYLQTRFNDRTYYRRNRTP